jgi:hypothetical protein
MPSFLSPSAGWVQLAQSLVTPSSALLTVAYNPATQPNPAIRYSDIYAAVATGANPPVFPGSSLAALMQQFAPGAVTTAADVEAACGIMWYRPGSNPGLLATARDAYFDLTDALASVSAGNILIYVGANPAPVLLAQGLSTAGIAFPGQYLTKNSSDTGLPVSTASRIVPIRWANVAKVLGAGSRLKPLITAQYATQESFDVMQATTGFFGYSVRTQQDALHEMSYWGPGEVGIYALPAASNGYQLSTQSIHRYTLPHSLGR